MLATRDAALAESATVLAHRAAELEGQRARIAQLELVCEWLSDRVVVAEHAMGDLRGQLALERRQAESVGQALIALAGELEGLRSSARGQATRIRLRALHDAADLAERVAEMSRRPVETRERLIESLQEAITRIGGAEEELEIALPALGRAGANGQAAVEASDLFNGMVEVEVGPLSDFSQLVGFEDAAGGIAATSEISVKRFAAGRATLEMRLDQPVELLRELEERSPFEFHVSRRRFDRLVLEVEGEAELDVEVEVEEA